MKKRAVIFLILFFLSFFISLFININKIDVPYFRGINKKICVDIILKNQNDNEVLLNDGFKQIKINENHYLFEQNNYKKINTISLKNTENIEKLIIYNGLETNFVKEIKNEYSINNSKSFFDKISVIFLSFFYNFQFYLIPYIFLFLFLKIQKLNIKNPLLFFFGLSLFLRITQLNYIPFWDDEIYVLNITSIDAPLKELFKDFGNPPLYFIFFKIYSLLIKNPDFYRYSSVILGLIFNYLFYVYLKNNFGKKQANLGLFVCSINIILIYYSQEIRSYILLMLLSVLNSICLLKFNTKKTFLYLIASTALIMTHYYGTFIFIFNFIFGLIIFFKNKIKLKHFIFSNITTFIILGLLIYSKINGVTTDFNTWIGPPTTDDLILTIKIFCPILFFIIFICSLAFIFSKTQKKLQKLTILYNFGLILSVITMSFIFSILIKPIFYYKYFYSIFPNFLILCTIIIAHNYKTKYRLILQTVLFIIFLTFQRVNYQNLYCNHNLYLNFIKNDIDTKKINYVFMTDTVEGYQPFTIQNANMIYLPVNIGVNEIDLTKFDNKPFCAYALNLYLNNATIEKAKNIELYKTPLGVFTKVEFK